MDEMTAAPWPSDNRVIEVAAVPRSGPWPRNT
jgi:hypothetical protein